MAPAGKVPPELWKGPQLVTKSDTKSLKNVIKNHYNSLQFKKKLKLEMSRISNGVMIITDWHSGRFAIYGSNQRKKDRTNQIDKN